MTLAKTLLAPVLFAALAAATALPASAAVYGNGNQLRRDISQLDRQIDRAQARHVLSGREAASLQAQVRTLDSTWRAYARGGFSRAETRSLDNRIDRVKRDFARQATDRNGRANERRDPRWGDAHRR